MECAKTVFIGADLFEYASNKIRCRDISNRLNCECLFGITRASQVPRKYNVFICVKPQLPAEELEKLSKRGVTVWDIVDFKPPVTGVDVYLASTRGVAEMFRHLGNIAIIPHHHCNFTGRPNSPRNRRAAWIGNHTWYPPLAGVPHDICFTRGMERIDVVRAYRAAGILLNLRLESDNSDAHVRLNSGIKLINAIGFGIPSISSNEPAYHEIAPECTIFSDLKSCGQWVAEISRNKSVYNILRRNCLRASREFHINEISKKYIKLIKSF